MDSLSPGLNGINKDSMQITTGSGSFANSYLYYQTSNNKKWVHFFGNIGITNPVVVSNKFVIKINENFGFETDVVECGIVTRWNNVSSFESALIVFHPSYAEISNRNYTGDIQSGGNMGLRFMILSTICPTNTSL